MKKLWLLFILVLATVTEATQQPNSINTALPEEKKPVLSKPVYYPLYNGGMIIDSSEVFLLGDQKILTSTYAAYKIMMDSAAKDSVFLHINSAYRTFEEQLLLRINNARRKHKSDTLFLLTADSKYFHPITARPGFSSHNKGIALDINTTDKQTFGWLKQNAIKYGFVRTVKSEKWHWEYRPEVTDQYQFVKENHKSWRL